MDVTILTINRECTAKAASRYSPAQRAWLSLKLGGASARFCFVKKEKGDKWLHLLILVAIFA
jgi:hypothetical protein